MGHRISLDVSEKRKICGPAGNLNQDRLAHNLDNLPTTQCQLPYICVIMKTDVYFAPVMNLHGNKLLIFKRHQHLCEY